MYEPRNTTKRFLIVFRRRIHARPHAPVTEMDMSENRDSQRDFGSDSVTIRTAGADDEAALRRLADLDSTRVPDGPVLVAEIAGRPVAAISVLSGDSFADPFVPTLELRPLLE